MKSKFGLWRIRIKIGRVFTIVLRNEGVVPFEIPDGSLEFIANLDDVEGEQHEAVTAKIMTNYWDYEYSQFNKKCEE